METKKRKKTNMYDKASNLYNNLIVIYFDKYNELLYAKKQNETQI